MEARFFTAGLAIDGSDCHRLALPVNGLR